MTFNTWTFVFEVVNFLVLAYILQRLLYRPLHDAIDRRRQGIEQAQAEAERASQEAEERSLELGAKLAAISEERRNVLEDAHREAEAQREQMLASAARETERRGALARERSERERAEALQSLQHDVIQQATRLAERLLREIAGEEMDTRLARTLVDTVRTIPPAQRTGLRRGWTTGATATLETAHDLAPDVVQQVRDAVAMLLGEDIDLVVQPVPELMTGVRLRLDGQVWDASLAGGLGEIDDGHASVGIR